MILQANKPNVLDREDVIILNWKDDDDDNNNDDDKFN